jgi:NAD-dependent dihydropyrimidine dehydrogenase PreA subunit
MGGGGWGSNTQHGVFIAVEIDPAIAADVELAKKLAEVCPVDIYRAEPDGVHINEENLDECVLCRLCIDASPPGAVKIHKLYSGETLE